jgi:hypothetical protein
MVASRSVGETPLVIWAAAVEPADVPTVRSAAVTSSPASKRPAIRPISHALPTDPAPPRTNARSQWGVEVMCGVEEGGVFMGVAFREVRVGRSRWRLPQSRSWLVEGAPCRYCVHGSHLLSIDRGRGNGITHSVAPNRGCRADRPRRAVGLGQSVPRPRRW